MYSGHGRAARYCFYAIGLFGLGFWLLVTALMTNQSCDCPFGAPTGEVVVPAGSDAAQRGFAYPGEGTPVYLLLGSPDVANLVLRYGIGVLALAAICAIVGRRFFQASDVMMAAAMGAFMPGFLIAFYFSTLRAALIQVIPVVIGLYFLVMILLARAKADDWIRYRRK